MATTELLRIDDLHLAIGGREVLKGLRLVIHEGERLVLFGQNGAGKSTLLCAIMGFPGYQITAGRIIFKGTDLTKLPVNERVKLGLGLAFQAPPAIRGVKLKELLRVCRREIRDGEIKSLAETFAMTEFLNRDINLGFSGGEAKRAEILQILVQRPDFVMFDEPDSGVDLENIELIGREINAYLKDHAGLIITHQGYILNFIEASRACVLYDGRIVCSGRPKEVLEDIKTKGYEGCVLCRTRKQEE